MAREPYDKNEDNNTEYQFTDDNENLEYDYQDKPPKKSRPKIKRRPILIIIIVLIAIYVIYKIVMILFGANTSAVAEEAKAREVKQQAITQIKQPAVNQVSQASLAQQDALMTQKDQLTSTQKQLGQQIQNLQTQNKALANQVEKQQFQSQTSMMGLQETIQNLNKQLSQMSSNIGDLQTSYEDNMKKQAKAARYRATANQRRNKAIRLKKQYVVDAVIPGRAWLKGADGSTVTIAVGDKLQGYGTVRKINPYSGQVVTSYGTIPYSAQ
jgi:intracellular multiplication protein IcmG